MKKLISILLSLMLVISSFSMFSFADDNGTSDVVSDPEITTDEFNEIDQNESDEGDIDNVIIEPELEDIDDSLVDVTMVDTDERNEFVENNKPELDVNEIVKTNANISILAGGGVNPAALTTQQDISNLASIENKKDGTILVHMPTISSNSYSNTYETGEVGTFSVHYGYKFVATSTNSLKKIYWVTNNINPNYGNSDGRYWFNGYVTDTTSFDSVDYTIDIKNNDKRNIYLGVMAHNSNFSCPAPSYEGALALTTKELPYKITFNLNGGTVGGASTNKNEWLYKNENIGTTFASPIKGEQVLEGWYTDPTGGTKVTTFTAEADTTYYAHYRTNNHTHSYSTRWYSDETQHWRKCTNTSDLCDAPKKDIANHIYGTSKESRYTCTVCSYIDSTRKAEADHEDELAKQLAKFKNEAIAAINNEKGSDTSPNVTSIANEAIASIRSATSESEIETIKNNAIDAIRTAKNDNRRLQEAKTAAIAAINTELGNNKAPLVIKAANDAIAAINSSTSITAVNNARSEGIDSIRATIELDESLKPFRTPAIAQINDEKGNDTSANVAKAAKDAILAINLSTSESEIETAKSNGISAIREAKEYNVRLNEAKVAAVEEINAEKGNDNAANVIKATQDAIAEINAQTSIEGVIQAKEVGIEKIKAIKEHNIQIGELKVAAKKAIEDELGNETSAEVIKVAKAAMAAIDASNSADYIIAARNKGIEDIRNARNTGNTGNTSNNIASNSNLYKKNVAKATKVNKLDNKSKDNVKTPKKIAMKVSNSQKSNNAKSGNSFFKDNLVYIIIIGVALLTATLLFIFKKLKYNSFRL